MLYAILSASQQAIFEREINWTLHTSTADTTRFRINMFRQLRGISAVLRIVPVEIRSFEELGLPRNNLKRFSLADRGLVLVTGPAGCGKSTTLAAMVDYINEHCEKHIITVEDPIEFIHKKQGMPH